MWQWQKRIAWGDGRNVALDFGTELWKWDIGAYESVDGIVAGLTRAGRSFDDESVLADATMTLMGDVVQAAGGVECAYGRFRRGVELTRDRYEEWAAKVDSDLTTGPEPEHGTWFSDLPFEDAWYALEDMIVWARTPDERLRRRAHDATRFPDQGLIPALADGPRRDAVIAARSRLLNSHLKEVRDLAVLNLHMQRTQAGTPRARVSSGQLILPFPDRLTGWVSHRWQLTYADSRDAVSYADSLMAAVERFMDEMLTAFEHHLPERFKIAPT
jgi:hypothetical protein